MQYFLILMLLFTAVYPVSANTENPDRQERGGGR